MKISLPNPLLFILSIIVPFIAAAVGNIATIPNIPTWYAALEKPFFNPPNWVFGPVWTILYFLMGIALYLLLTTPHKHKRNAYIAYGCQLILNALWSISFFGLHLLEVSVAVILVLLAAILLTIRFLWPISPRAGMLLLPYAAWVSFATCLTIAITILN